MAEPRAAFQGEHGAFSEEAAVRWFGAGVTTLPCRDFAAVAATVLDGTATHGVLPVENVIHGSVLPSYDVLAAGGLTVVGEIIHPIRLMLMAPPGTRLDQLHSVWSHPVALNQCTRFLATHPRLQPVPHFDTAGAARDVASRGEAGVAAIAPAGAARRYGLDILAEAVEDRADNQTRFFIVTPAAAGAPLAGVDDGAPCRAVLLVDAAHEPGALLRLLEPLAAQRINLTRIESRPAREPWSYYFFIEATAPGRGALAHALRAMEPAARRVTVLGVMPVAPR